MATPIDAHTQEGSLTKARCVKAVNLTPQWPWSGTGGGGATGMGEPKNIHPQSR